jgi:hypothetical protein
VLVTSGFNMKLTGIQYQDNLGGLAKRDINQPLRVAGARANAAGAQAGAAGQEAQSARALASLYGNTAKVITEVEDYFLDQEVTRQVQEAQSNQKIALKELSEAQDRINPETGEPAWKSLPNYKEQQEEITANVTEDMSPRARAEFDPWAMKANDASMLGQMERADSWRREDNKLQTYKQMDVEEKSKQFLSAHETNNVALEQQTISPAEHWKNKQRIDTASTIDSHVNEVGAAYVETGNAKALTDHKEMVMSDTSLSPAQRKSSVAQIEQMQMNKVLKEYHGYIQGIEKAKNLDVAVAKGEDKLNEILRTDANALGGDDEFKHQVYTQMRTELSHYQQQLAKRDVVGKDLSLMSLPLQMSQGDADPQGKIGNAQNIAYMTDVEGNEMPREDYLKNSPSPIDGETPILHITGYITGKNGHIPKSSVQIFNATVNQDPKEQVAGLQALKTTLEYSGRQGSRILNDSKISQPLMNRLVFSNVIGDEQAVKLMSNYEANAPGLNTQFSSPEAKKEFNEVWQDDSDDIISGIIEDKGTFNDTEYDISKVNKNQISAIAKKLYPMAQNPELAIQAATEQVLASAVYTKDYTTGTPTFTKKVNSITNVRGFDQLSQGDQEVAGGIAYTAAVEFNAGVEVDRNRMMYTTDVASTPNSPILRATYVGKDGAYVTTGPIQINKTELPDTMEAIKNNRILNQQKERRQTQLNLVEQASKQQAAGEAITRAQGAALIEEEGKGKVPTNAYVGQSVSAMMDFTKTSLSISLGIFSNMINTPVKMKDAYVDMRREQERSNAAK